jgi:hypothetical protein
MKQSHVSRKDLLGMRVGSTRVFWLTDKTKLQSAASTMSALKNEGKGEWSHGKDYENVAISVKRLK